jgi:hypothetical protein
MTMRVRSRMGKNRQTERRGLKALIAPKTLFFLGGRRSRARRYFSTSTRTVTVKNSLAQ